jgi:nucleoside-specific outer membrane channel protein Tsx
MGKETADVMKKLLLAGASLLALSAGVKATTFGYTGDEQSFIVPTTGLGLCG